MKDVNSKRRWSLLDYIHFLVLIIWLSWQYQKENTQNTRSGNIGHCVNLTGDFPFPYHINTINLNIHFHTYSNTCQTDDPIRKLFLLWWLLVVEQWSCMSRPKCPCPIHSSNKGRDSGWNTSHCTRTPWERDKEAHLKRMCYVNVPWSALHQGWSGFFFSIFQLKTTEPQPEISV